MTTWNISIGNNQITLGEGKPIYMKSWNFYCHHFVCEPREPALALMRSWLMSSCPIYWSLRSSSIMEDAHILHFSKEPTQPFPRSTFHYSSNIPPELLAKLLAKQPINSPGPYFWPFCLPSKVNNQMHCW